MSGNTVTKTDWLDDMTFLVLSTDNILRFLVVGRVCVRVCVRACVRVCVCVYVCICVYTLFDVICPYKHGLQVMFCLCEQRYSPNQSWEELQTAASHN